jgi:GMP synthase-like glutamine amidotransferase
VTATCLVIEHLATEGPYVLGDHLRASGVTLDRRALVAGDEVPLDASGLDGIVVMGGPMSATSDHGFPTRSAELALLADGLERGVPILGICLGAQLLAAAAGGVVKAGTAGQEIGWGAITLTDAAESDWLLRALPSSFEVLHWHGDTFELPVGAVHLAASDRYVNQAFRLGRSAWGLQFHLEVDATAVAAFVAGFGEEAEDAGVAPAAILEEAPSVLASLTDLQAVVAGRFADLVRARAARSLG